MCFIPVCPELPQRGYVGVRPISRSKHCFIMKKKVRGAWTVTEEYGRGVRELRHSRTYRSKYLHS